MREMVAIVLALSAIILAKATIYINAKGEVPSLYMITVQEKLPSNVTYILGNVKIATTNVTLEGVQKKGYVEEKVKVEHSASIINSKLKNAMIKIDGSYSENTLNVRIRGTISMVLSMGEISIPVYLRDVDLHIIATLKDVPTARIGGFVILPLPPKPVENLLQRMKNVIENRVNALGMYIEKFEYKVGKARIFSKVDLQISGKVTDKNIRNMLKMIEEMGANKASFDMTLRAVTTRLSEKEAIMFLTKVNIEGEGVGITMNKTIEDIIKDRIKMVENLTDVNVRRLLDHVTASGKYAVKTIVKYIGNMLEAKIEFKGVYLKPDFWRPLWEVAKERGINVIVLCPSGEKILTGPQPPC